MATTQNYFPRKSESAPMIYAYEDKYDPNLKGLLKVGYTTIGVQERVRQQYNIVRPGEPPYRILVEESAMRQDGTAFMNSSPSKTSRNRGRTKNSIRSMG